MNSQSYEEKGRAGLLNIKDVVQNGLVIFYGAGVSMVPPTQLPSWWEMNEQVVKALSLQIVPFYGKDKATELANQINSRRENERFPPEYQAEIITKYYGPSYFKVLQCLDGDEPNAVHLAIASLAKSGHVRAIVTSNFDRLLEVAFNKLDIPLDVHYESGHFEKLAKKIEKSPEELSQCQLLKLHGSVDNHETLVDTLAQRMRGFTQAQYNCLKHLLRNYYWLFLGYSGADLEANEQYLCLKSEVNNAVGFSWLIRESAKNEPLKAVKKISDLYGDRADLPRGELPGWFVRQFGSLLPADLPIPAKESNQVQDRRKQEATQAIKDHTHLWSKELGGIRASLILSDMLDRSVSNPQAAIELLNRAIETFSDDHKAYTSIANKMANILMDNGELDDAMKFANKALEKIESSDKRNHAGILNTLGLIEHKRGKYKQALILFEQVYNTYSLAKDENKKNIALHNQAMALMSLGDYDRAMQCYEKELMIVKEMGDVFAQAEVLNNMGDLKREQGQYDEAIEILKQGINLRDRLGDDRGVAMSMGNIGAVHQEKGEFEKAKSIYEKILAIFQRIGDQPGEVNTYLNLGSITQELGKIEEAKTLYKQAISLAEKCGLESDRINGLWKLASTIRISNHSDRASEEALPLLNEALTYYQDHNDKNGEANVLNEIGVLLLKNQKFDKAEDMFNKAISIRKQLKQPTGCCESIGNLALVHIERGELKKALVLLEEKLTIAESKQLKVQKAFALYNIGAVQLQQNDIDKALDSFNVSQHLFQEMGVSDRAIGILAIMGEVCGNEGRIDVSLQWFDKAIEIATTVEQRTKISQRLANNLTLMLQNNHPDAAKLYVTRLESVGAQVDIEGL